MNSLIVEAYAALAASQQLVPFIYKAPMLGGNEIRIRVTHCGVCYSDIHAIEDLYNVTTYPFVPGHEIVGNIMETGQDVKDFQVGDRVGVGWQGRSCGTCVLCIRGEDQLCENVAKNGVWMPFGGFASSTVADSRFTYPLPEGMPAEDASVLLCAGISVFNALNKFRTSEQLKIGIIGVGGLGHLAIQFAHAMGYHVTAMSSSALKRSEALTFGADEFICTAEQDAFMNRGESFDMLFCTAHGNIR